MILAIYGAGGLGFEVLDLAGYLNQRHERWSRVVFVDDRIDRCRSTDSDRLSFPIVAAEFNRADVEFIVAVGEPAIRADLQSKVASAGFHFATLIHPSATVSPSAVVGGGCIVCHGAFISSRARVNANVLMQPCACVGHDAVVDSSSVLSSFVCLGGNTFVGARTYIGMSVPVKEGTRIGDDVIVGMGSAVFRDIDSGVIALGNPARPMAKNDRKRVFGK